MRLIAGVSALLLAVACAGVVLGTPALTKAQYVAKLRAANAASSKADDAASAAAGSSSSTPAKVRNLLLAMGRRHVAIGHQFSVLAPPKSAVKANGDFARAEILFGKQNERIALELPTSSRQAMVRYLQALKPPSGGQLLDHAIAELHAAGYKI